MTDKVQLIKEEIERRIKNLEFSLENNCVERYSKLDILGNITTLESLLQFIDSLQEETKPQFPNYESVVDKVFGAGNLESWEYEEAEKLVLLAKEELLKDLESGCEADCTTKNEDLEAEIQRYFSEEKWIEKPIAEIAIHFANWQHGKDFDDLLQSEMKFPKEYYERGRADMREEMMKDAADSKITTDGDSILPIIKYQLPLTYDCKIGDKVKLIIIKED